MPHKSSSTKPSQRETNPSALRLALIRRVDHRSLAEGQVDFPCLPSMLDVYMKKLATLWEVLGKPFKEEELATLREIMEKTLISGHQSSPYARIIVGFQNRPAPEGIKYLVRLNAQTLEQIYSTGWIGEGKETPFGRLPDAKVMALAASLGDPASAPVLDIGAGTGRNSIPLARRGHPTYAIEPVATLASEMRKVAESERLALEVTQADFLAPGLVLRPAHYKLAVIAEVLSHFRSSSDARRLFETLVPAMAPGGLVLVSAFLSSDGYKPDELAREVTGFAWSTIFTRAEIKFITDELPFDKLSDESVHDFEKEHLPESAWPPTPWFPSWSRGTDAFDVPLGKAPMDLRWLVYRRRA
jgi:2-polyprenyl-3-methyl-5-hydroxy-6-metoxy-1,4-benzoquinol methylase